MAKRGAPLVAGRGGRPPRPGFRPRSLRRPRCAPGPLRGVRHARRATVRRQGSRLRRRGSGARAPCGSRPRPPCTRLPGRGCARSGRGCRGCRSRVRRHENRRARAGPRPAHPSRGRPGPAPGRPGPGSSRSSIAATAGAGNFSRRAFIPASNCARACSGVSSRRGGSPASATCRRKAWISGCTSVGIIHRLRTRTTRAAGRSWYEIAALHAGAPRCAGRGGGPRVPRPPRSARRRSWSDAAGDGHRSPSPAPPSNRTRSPPLRREGRRLPKEGQRRPRADLLATAGLSGSVVVVPVELVGERRGSVGKAGATRARTSPV